MAPHKLVAYSILTTWISISAAQIKTTRQQGNKNINGPRGFIQFTSDGTTFAMDPDKDTVIKMTGELKYSGTTTQLLLALYTKSDSRDTIVLYIYDAQGLNAGSSAAFSKNAKLVFIYKLFGKGSMIKTLDNAKGEISAANYITITKLEPKPGGTVEGAFSFTNIPFENKIGKVVAKIRGISAGRFKTTITEYDEIKVTNATAGIVTTEANKLSPVAKLLFKNVESKLSDAEKNQVAGLTGFLLSGKTDQPFAMNKESLEYPYTADVTITDMNKDGIQEVFILFGNTFTSGNTGQSISLFIKDKEGDYKLNLGFPGLLPDQLKTGFGGYPDLLIGGPGFNLPIWRWSGNEYKFHRTQK
jgi:hypothetical protein